ncbi:radical SAM protein [Lactobacillus salivarius]|uniref:Radical SAM protein n=1 Tax=Ligilactobacillus salivarius TaxID=1624 RepID=A0A6A8LVJ1_9LACO|nr:radical SAM protein [Ligilactobacillus salivarius]MSE06982.1 radical SAM protein [Ligilactobacillus salivarius]MSE07975.1 radical SAM protein [Ligilactobacillus salivarius]
MEKLCPDILTIITTYHCTAECEECCFECSPKLKSRLSLGQIEDFMDEAKELFGNQIKGVVFTGGECFTLGEDLIRAVDKAHSLGYSTRCVSNGYWARTMMTARKKLMELKDAGLDELNISTGDNHQQWISFESVLNAIEVSSELGINSLIVVEGFEESKFKMADIVNNIRFRKIKEKQVLGYNKGNIGVLNNIWIPMHEEAKITQKEDYYITEERALKSEGCNNILTTLGLNPYGKIIDCCGLTMEHIPEMKLGTYEKGNLEYIFNKQFNDFMKIWLWVEGPFKILYYALRKDKNIKINKKLTHPCQACVEIFSNSEIKNTLKTNYQDVVEDVMFKYAIKLKKYKLDKQTSFVYQ